MNQTVRPSSRVLRVFALTVLLVVQASAPGCGGGSNKSPNNSGCINLGGTYTATFSDGCGKPTDTKVVIDQLGCHLSSNFTGLGQVHGDIDSFGVWRFDIFPDAPCSGTISGTAYQGTPISGSFSGSMGGSGCCAAVSETFTLVKR